MYAVNHTKVSTIRTVLKVSGLLVILVLSSCQPERPVSEQPALISPLQHPPDTDPTKAEAHYNQGVALFNSGDFGQAITNFDNALELNPDYAEAYYTRGDAYSRLGNADHAIKDFKTYLELAPDGPYREWVEDFVEGVHQDLELEQRLTKTIKLNPDDAEAYLTRGQAYLKQRFVFAKSKSDALQDFKTYLELAPDAPNRVEVEDFIEGIHHGLELDQAIAELDKTIKLNPDDAEAYLNRGLAYVDYSLNEPGLYLSIFIYFEQAIRDFTKVIEFDPDNTEAYSKRGLVYDFLGNLTPFASPPSKISLPGRFFDHARRSGRSPAGLLRASHQGFHQGHRARPRQTRGLF